MAAENKRYLDMLNLHSAEEAYRQVRELASSLSSDQHLIRSCIFDLHAAVEIELKRVFYHTFKGQLFLTDEEQHNSETVAELDKMIRRLGFAEMYRILRPALDSWPYPELKWIGEINNTRNAAAHSDAVERVSYKGRNPFNDPDSFAQMYLDVWAITQAMAKFFEWVIERPKV
ncbi:MAG TPA: hypothetical protein VNU00_03055 [Candidatus Binataceae bacterium]|nr:hypothetical protein [Candidatus Binataceae bacterium]